MIPTQQLMVNNSGSHYASMGSLQPIKNVCARDRGSQSVLPRSRIDAPCIPASGQ
jgi:hypothetical protein